MKKYTLKNKQSADSQGLGMEYVFTTELDNKGWDLTEISTIEWREKSHEQQIANRDKHPAGLGILQEDGSTVFYYEGTVGELKKILENHLNNKK